MVEEAESWWILRCWFGAIGLHDKLRAAGPLLDDEPSHLEAAARKPQFSRGLCSRGKATPVAHQRQLKGRPRSQHHDYDCRFIAIYS